MYNMSVDANLGMYDDLGMMMLQQGRGYMTPMYGLNMQPGLANDTFAPRKKNNKGAKICLAIFGTAAAIIGAAFLLKGKGLGKAVKSIASKAGAAANSSAKTATTAASKTLPAPAVKSLPEAPKLLTYQPTTPTAQTPKPNIIDLPPIPKIIELGPPPTIAPAAKGKGLLARAQAFLDAQAAAAPVVKTQGQWTAGLEQITKNHSVKTQDEWIAGLKQFTKN
jgi:hypothetical protein